MSARAEAASLILRLYEIRREPAMRDARRWFASEFDPTEAGQIVELLRSSFDDSARYRMVTTYWEMACSFVTHGAIDAAMFNDANTEHVAFYARLKPFLDDMRVQLGIPRYMLNLERVALAAPNAEEEIERRARLLRHWTRSTTADPESE
jgi:hypothetical protein